MRLKTTIVACILLTLSATVATAEPKATPPPELKTSLVGGKVVIWVNAQLRDRFETHDEKDLDPDTRSEYITQRARLGVGAKFLERFSVYFQLQDVRLWGSEQSTLGDFSADGLDAHQAWGQVRLFRGLHLKIGRQEIAFDDHRIIGTVNWTMQGRAFDAARLFYQHKAFYGEVFYARVAEKQDGTGTTEADRSLMGAYFKLLKYKFVKPSLLLVSEVDWDNEITRHRHTMGTRVHGGFKGFTYSLAFYYQVGEQGDTKFSSYLFGGRLGYRLEVRTRPGIVVWADLVSGDRDQGDNVSRAFDTLYATNHKFYGFMDLFLNIPVHTGGNGLQDFGARLHIAPVKKLWIAVDYHLLRLMIPNGTSIAGTRSQGLGNEIDITVRYKLLKWVSLQAGYGVLVPMQALENLKDGANHTEHWFYAQTNIAF